MANSISEKTLHRLPGLPSMRIQSPLLQPPVFCENAKAANVSVIDIHHEQPSAPRIFRDEEQLKWHITSEPEPSVRIISISSKSSIKPLEISQSTMHALLNHYDIGIEFLELVQTFGQKPHVSDAGHGAMSVRRRANGAYDTQYLLPYIAEYGGGSSTKWTDRWLGVFHRFSPEENGPGRSLWIFLYANQNSEAQHRIQSIGSLHADLSRHPQSVHLAAFSSYIGNWRWCIRSLGEEVERMADHVTVSKFTEEKNHGQALDWLVQLSALREKLCPLPGKLRVTQQILRKLDEMNGVFHQHQQDDHPIYMETADTLAFYLRRVEGHLQSLQALDNNLQSTLNLVCLPFSFLSSSHSFSLLFAIAADWMGKLEVAVDLGNRTTAGEINKKMLKLTTHSVDDSAAVRVITFLTMLYLPPSFVSTFLGMELFSFHDAAGSSQFAVSKHFWIFVALCAPLSALTFLSWKLFWNKHRQKRRETDTEQPQEKDIELGIAG
ncbi:hypothetical protein BJX61DRAFT_544665 [Aspergillus egyptiacus]|nr:hypothetical protein BJX61DRAFT_544665 [Aspergillus egyptiacus]